MRVGDESRLQLLNCGQEGADSGIDGRRVRGSVCAVARSNARCAGGGVGGGKIASVRSTSGDSTGLAGSAWTCARATTVASPSSSMLDDDSARFERARARVLSAGVDSIDRDRSKRAQSERMYSNKIEQQYESCDEPQETENRGDCDGCSEREEQRDDSGGDSDDENRENDDRDECEAEGDHARTATRQDGREIETRGSTACFSTLGSKYRTGHGTSCYSRTLRFCECEYLRY